MKLILSVLVGLALSVSVAAAEQYSGIDLSQGNSVQMQLCSLKPGKSMENYDRVIRDYIQWSRDNDVELFLMRATPLFLSPPPNGGQQIDFLELLVAPYGVAGTGWDKWLTTEESKKINARWQETADCRVTMNSGFVLALDREALSSRDDRVLSFNWCTRNDGVSVDQLQAKHQQIAGNWNTDSPIKAWTIMVPGLGSRNTPGDFAHLLSFEDVSGLMAWQNALANEEGWRARMDYETSYANCIGDNAYHVQVLNRPGS
jgi:hypothetical protein